MVSIIPLPISTYCRITPIGNTFLRPDKTLIATNYSEENLSSSQAFITWNGYLIRNCSMNSKGVKENAYKKLIIFSGPEIRLIPLLRFALFFVLDHMNPVSGIIELDDIHI